MGLACELAAHVRRRCRVRGVATTDQIEEMIYSEGLTLNPDWPFRGNILGAFTRIGAEGYIVVRAGLSEPERRWVLLHELAHGLLHGGDQVQLRLANDVRAWQQEHKADQVAGWLCWGGAVLCPRHQGLSVEALADWAALPLEVVAHWWEIAEWEVQREIELRSELRERHQVGPAARHLPPSAQLSDVRVTTNG